jgi:hypothetical protein
MRCATWNVNSLKARLPLLERWVSVVQPDVLCLQETKLADDAFPTGFFADLGYESAHHGNGRWNGVAIAAGGTIEPATSTRVEAWDRPLPVSRPLASHRVGAHRPQCPSGAGIQDRAAAKRSCSGDRADLLLTAESGGASAVSARVCYDCLVKL